MLTKRTRTGRPPASASSTSASATPGTHSGTRRTSASSAQPRSGAQSRSTLVAMLRIPEGVSAELAGPGPGGGVAGLEPAAALLDVQGVPARRLQQRFIGAGLLG